MLMCVAVIVLATNALGQECQKALDSCRAANPSGYACVRNDVYFDSVDEQKKCCLVYIAPYARCLAKSGCKGLLKDTTVSSRMATCKALGKPVMAPYPLGKSKPQCPSLLAYCHDAEAPGYACVRADYYFDSLDEIQNCCELHIARYAKCLSSFAGVCRDFGVDDTVASRMATCKALGMKVKAAYDTSLAEPQCPSLARYCSATQTPGSNCVRAPYYFDSIAAQKMCCSRSIEPFVLCLNKFGKPCREFLERDDVANTLKTCQLYGYKIPPYELSRSEPICSVIFSACVEANPIGYECFRFDTVTRPCCEKSLGKHKACLAYYAKSSKWDNMSIAINLYGRMCGKKGFNVPSVKPAPAFKV